MAKLILIEEFHVTLFMRRRLRKRELRAIRRTLNGRSFQAELSCVVNSVLRRYPSLKQIRPNISR